MKTFVPVREVAAIAGVSLRTIWRHRDLGILDAVQVGGIQGNHQPGYFVTRDALDRYLGAPRNAAGGVIWPRNEDGSPLWK